MTVVVLIILNGRPSENLSDAMIKVYLLYDSYRHYCQIKDEENDSKSEPSVPVLDQVGPGFCPSVMGYQQSLRKYKRATLTFF